MAIEKNFVVRHGLEVNNNLIYADNYENRVGIGTTNMLEKLHVDGGVYVSEDINARNINLTGVSSISTINSTNVYVNTGIITTLSGTTATYATGNFTTGVVTTLTSTNATITNLTGTAVTYTRGNIINLSGSNLNYSGIATVNSLSIGSTEVISSSRQLKNITSLDATTTSTIETAIANAPNTFTDIQVTGISTFTNGPVLIGTGTSTGVASQPLQVSGSAYVSDRVGIGTTIPRSNLHVVGHALVSGIVTASLFYGEFDGTDLYIHGTGFFTDTVTASSFIGDLIGNASGLTGDPNIQVTDLTVIGESIFDSGNVGIGTTNPTSALTVVGDALVSGIVTASSFVGNLTGTAGYANTSGIATYANTAGVSTVAQGLSGTPNILVGITTVSRLNIGTGGTVITTTSGGLVGIGTTNPTSALTVTGSGTSTSQLYVSGVSTCTNKLDVVFSSGLNPGINLNDTSNNTLIGMYYDTSSTQSYLISTQKNLNLKVYAPQDVAILAGDETMALFESNAGVSLYYDNSKKFETIGTGVTVTGTTFTNQLSSSGVTTSQGGFTSGIGVTNPVQITVSGNVLTFTVAGVGSTSLTLY